MQHLNSSKTTPRLIFNAVVSSESAGFGALLSNDEVATVAGSGASVLGAKVGVAAIRVFSGAGH